MHDINALKSSIKGLRQQFGQAQPSTAIIINLTIALPGLLLLVHSNQWVQLTGLAWIILNIYPLLRYVTSHLSGVTGW